jgi:hypothetical protein
MRKLLTVFILAIMVSGIASAAGKRARVANHPARYLPNSFDGAIVQVENAVDGRVWAAWSYRNGGEYDLALSVSPAPGVWSEPLLVGLDDGIDQRQPAMALDSRGAMYVAYADGAGGIRLTVLQPGGVQWSPPVTVASGNGDLSRPSLMVSGSALIVGYRDGAGVALQAVPLLSPNPVNSLRAIYDGPDPITGYDDDEDSDDPSSEDTDVYSMNPTGGVNVRPMGSGTHRDDD